MNNVSRDWRLLFVLCFLQGCVSTSQKDLTAIEELRPPKSGSTIEASETPRHEEARTTVNLAPSSGYKAGEASTSQLNVDDSFPEVTFKGSYNNMSVAAFVNEVFGNQLGLSFNIDSGVQSMEDLVSLRLLEEVSPDRLFVVAQQTLSSYGVAITSQQGIYSFQLDNDAAAGDLPLVVSGRSLPDVPASHRPIFLFVPIEVVNSNALNNWLTPIVRGQNLKTQVVPEANALLIRGKREAVEQVLGMIQLLDQPAMRGNYSAVVEPVYTEAGPLAKDLLEVLRSQGYNASNRTPQGGIMVLPMQSSNKIVITASAEETLEHVLEWSVSLDRQTTSGIENGVFSYRARNTDVEYLVELLNQLNGVNSEGTSVGATTDVGSSGGRSQFIADRNRNAVVYRGSGRDWVELLPAIQDMDQPAPSVLVEVVLAEVTLNDQDETGIEFLARSGDVTFSTQGGLGLGSNGLTAILNRAGETRAVLNAFAKSDRANIRSRPRLMVKSGQLASIDVGNEIPFVTSTSQSTDNPDSPVIQTVSYRKTGVILEIEPVVHSSGYVDIRISQELSEAQQTSTSAIDSPTIFNRRLQTTVTLRDGGSVLLGGLISETSSDSNNRIKGLGQIPGVGRLFRSDSKSTDKTELVMMVVPYIIENPDEASKITDKALEFLELTR